MMKIMDVLADTRLFSPDEIHILKNYVSGTMQGKKVHESFHRDLSRWNRAEAIFSMYESLYKRKDYGGMEKLARILFSIGQATIYHIFPRSYYDGEEDEMLPLPPDQKAAIYAASVVAKQEEITPGVLDKLSAIAQDSLENLEKANSYDVGRSQRGRLLLLATYFIKCYPKRERYVWSAPVPRGVLIRNYEQLLMARITDIYQDAASWDDIRRLVDGASPEWMAEHGLNGASIRIQDSYSLRFIGAVSYINYQLSRRLRNIVGVCLAANIDVMAGVMKTMDIWGFYEEERRMLEVIFHLDAVVYFDWILKKDEMDIAWRLYNDSREAVEGYMKKMEALPSSGQIQKFKAEIERRMSDESREQAGADVQDWLVNSMISCVQVEFKSTLKDYLYGAGIESLRWLMQNSIGETAKWGEEGWAAMKKYEKRYGCDKLVTRCETALLACAGKSGDSLKAKDIMRMVKSAEEEGLNLQERMRGFGSLYTSCTRNEKREVLTKVGKDIFGQYYAQNGQEIREIIEDGDSDSRYLALLLMAEDPDKNKEELFSYMCDTSKVVRDMLLEILYGLKVYEEDMVKLLSASRKEQREVAVRVLMRWDARKYAPLFQEAYKKEKSGIVRAWLADALEAGK